MIAAHAALLALKSRRPVKLVYSRAETSWRRRSAILRSCGTGRVCVATGG